MTLPIDHITSSTNSQIRSVLKSLKWLSVKIFQNDEDPCTHEVYFKDPAIICHLTVIAKQDSIIKHLILYQLEVNHYYEGINYLILEM